MALLVRKPDFGVGNQQRRRSACASTQSDQSFCSSLPMQSSILKLVSVTAQAGLHTIWSETPKAGFIATRPNCVVLMGSLYEGVANTYPIPYGPRLPNPHQSLMGCPYRTNINTCTDFGAMWAAMFCLLGRTLARVDRFQTAFLYMYMYVWLE